MCGLGTALTRFRDESFVGEIERDGSKVRHERHNRRGDGEQFYAATIRGNMKQLHESAVLNYFLSITLFARQNALCSKSGIDCDPGMVPEGEEPGPSGWEMPRGKNNVRKGSEALRAILE